MERSVEYIASGNSGYKEFMCPHCGALLFDIFLRGSTWMTSISGIPISALVGICPQCEKAFAFGNPKRIVKLEGGTITDENLYNPDD